MIRAFSLVVVVVSILTTGCSHKSEPRYFATYEEAKDFCDAAIKSKDLSSLVGYANLEGVPKTNREHFKEGLNNFESAISGKSLEEALELTQEGYDQHNKDEYENMHPGLKEMMGPPPEEKWNIKPDKYLVYRFAQRFPNGDYSEFKLTFGLSHQDQGWCLVCSY